MAMSGASLAKRWEAKLAGKFKGTYDNAFMADMAQCIVDEIIENMEIETVVETKGSPAAQSGEGKAGMGIGVIQ